MTKKAKEPKCIEVERMVRVSDGWKWCPPFPDDKVKLRLIAAPVKSYEKQKDIKGYVKISATGYDDTFVELEQHTSTFDSALALFYHWKRYIFDRVADGVSMEWFYEHGFYSG